MTQEARFKIGQNVWVRPLDRMGEIELIQCWSHELAAYETSYKIKGCVGLFRAEQLVSKDVPMFASANGASQGQKLTEIACDKPMLRSAKNVLMDEVAKAFELSGEVYAELARDPLKWIELLARYQRERLESGE